jgi:hypothetical protein
MTKDEVETLITLIDCMVTLGDTDLSPHYRDELEYEVDKLKQKLIRPENIRDEVFKRLKEL